MGAKRCGKTTEEPSHRLFYWVNVYPVGWITRRGPYPSLSSLRNQFNFIESLADVMSHVNEELVCFGNAETERLNVWKDTECVSDSIRGCNSANVTRLTSLDAATKKSRLRFFNSADGQDFVREFICTNRRSRHHHGGRLSVARTKQEAQAIVPCTNACYFMFTRV